MEESLVLSVSAPVDAKFRQVAEAVDRELVF